MKVLYLILHHSAVSRTKNPVQFQAINNYHRSKWNSPSTLGYYGGYHYLIEPSGQTRQYRAETEEGIHTVGYNFNSIGICFTGNFDEELPTAEQLESGEKLINELQKKYPKAKIAYHRDFANKTCPGIKFNYFKFMETNVKLIKNGNEIAFYLPATNQEALKAMALHYGIEIPVLEDGSVNWAKIKFDYIIK